MEAERDENTRHTPTYQLVPSLGSRLHRRHYAACLHKSRRLSPFHKPTKKKKKKKKHKDDIKNRNSRLRLSRYIKENIHATRCFCDAILRRRIRHNTLCSSNAFFSLCLSYPSIYPPTFSLQPNLYMISVKCPFGQKTNCRK